MAEFVTPEHLLKGAAYALEQSGLLLRDANTLYRSKAYASAVALAAFAWEELGKSKMLLALRREVVGGKQVTVEDVEDYCFGHEAKQKAGMGSVTIRDSSPGAIKAWGEAEIGSDKWKAAREKIDQQVAEKAARLPSERHSDRMISLYVDPLSTTEWSRPAEKITQQFAMEFLIDAANEARHVVTSGHMRRSKQCLLYTQ